MHIHVHSTCTSIYMYSTAGHFCGLKLSRIDENIDFREKTLADCQSGVWAGPYYTTDKTFAEGGNTAKFAKVFTHESFRLIRYIFLCVRILYNVHV